MCTNNIFNEHMCVHTCMWLKECCAMNTLATENVHWEQVHTGKILLLDVLRGSNKTINLQIYKSYIDASEKNKGMSYNLWNPSEHIKESETEEGTRTKRQEGKKKPSAWVPLGKQNQLSSPSTIGSRGLHWRICCQSLGIVIVIFIFQKDKLRLRDFSTYSETYCSFLVEFICLITSPPG